MTQRSLTASAAAFVILLARVASAQQTNGAAQADSPSWVKDPRLGEGGGLRTGDLQLHLSLAGEAGYDSNYFLRSSTTGVANGPPNAPIIPAIEFRITPSLTIQTLGQDNHGGGGAPPPVALRAGVSATYRDFIGISSDSQASKSQNDISSNRNVSGTANARLDILPGRPWAAAVTGIYVRTIQPNTLNANPDLSFNTDTVGGAAELIAQPQSGTLDWRLGGSYTAVLFEQSQAQPFTNGSASAYTRGRWTFRPRSSLLFNGTLGFSSFTNSSSASQEGLQSSTPVRAVLGINTLITNRFALLALGGWGASFINESQNSRQPQFDSAIGQAELRWFVSESPGIQQASDLTLPLSSIAVGYARDFQVSYLSNFYGTDRGYLRFSYFFGGHATLSLEGGVAAIEYPTFYWQDNTVRQTSFTDARADATLFGEYRVTPTVGINATARYSQNFSGTQIKILENPPVGEMGGLNLYDMAWSRFEAFIGVRWFM